MILPPDNSTPPEDSEGSPEGERIPEPLRAALLEFYEWCEGQQRRLARFWTCDHEEAALLVDADMRHVYGESGFPRNVLAWAPGVFRKKLGQIWRRRIRIVSLSLSLSLSEEDRWIREPWAARGLGASGWVDLIDHREKIEVLLSPQQRRVLAAFLDKNCQTEAEIAKELDMEICSVLKDLERIGRKNRKNCQPKDT